MTEFHRLATIGVEKVPERFGGLDAGHIGAVDEREGPDRLSEVMTQGTPKSH